jgi:ribosomal-protein-alanine N-acetyltransferase
VTPDLSDRVGAPEGIRLRPATAEDVPRLAQLERDAFPDPWDAAAFRSLLRSATNRVTVADDDGLVVGYTVVVRAADEGELANIAVAPERRGRGVGRRLLADALTRASADAVSAVYLEVRESNAAARHLYESAGFEAIGRRRRYYRSPDEDAVLMRWRPSGAFGDAAQS